MEIYEPREDSFMIAKEIRAFATGKVLDMGTGSGILAREASKTAEEVIALDINKDAVKEASQIARFKGIKNITFRQSDLFSYFKDNNQRFDLIIFNPPYLPEDKAEPKESALATTGGKKGYELLEKFFEKASEHLLPFGKILVLFSSLTGKDKVHNIIETYGFNFQKLAEEHFFQETLFVYLAEKSDLLRSLEGKNIKNIKRLAKGHRGLIFTGKLGKKKVAIKKQREDITAIGRIDNEARWLKVLNRKNIGPKFLFMDDSYFVYEFVEGEFFPKYIETAKKQEIKKVILDILKQCFILDKRGINKEEMHHPYKHILVNKKPVLIDFERTHVTEKPQNVTQFCQYITSGNIKNKLKDFKLNKTDITQAAKKYKEDISEKTFKNILKLIR